MFKTALVKLTLLEMFLYIGYLMVRSCGRGVLFNVNKCIDNLHLSELSIASKVFYIQCVSVILYRVCRAYVISRTAFSFFYRRVVQ